MSLFMVKIVGRNFNRGKQRKNKRDTTLKMYHQKGDNSAEPL